MCVQWTMSLHECSGYVGTAPSSSAPDGQPVGWWPASVDHPVGAVREATDRMTRAASTAPLVIDNLNPGDDADA